MSITSDIRSYADNAVTEGKKVLDQAQAQLNDVTGQANDIVGKYRDNVSSIAEKATDAVNDLRTSAEKAVNLEAIKSAIEPYLSQVKGYQTSVQEKAEDLFAQLKGDPRFSKLVDAAESVSGAVVETVQDRVVKPVQSLTNRGTKTAPVSKPAARPAKPAAKPSPAKATKPAATKPAAKKPAARKPAARKTTKA